MYLVKSYFNKSNLQSFLKKLHSVGLVTFCSNMTVVKYRLSPLDNPSYEKAIHFRLSS